MAIMPIPGNVSLPSRVTMLWSTLSAEMQVNILEQVICTCSDAFIVRIYVRWTTNVLTMIWIIILPAGDYFMAAMLDLRHLGPSGPTQFVFHRIPLIRKHICRHKIRVSMIVFRESMIIYSTWSNMGRIGNFFIFKPHFDNVPEFSRLYTFSMS